MKKFVGSYIPSGYQFLLVSIVLIMGIGTTFRLILFLSNPGLASRSSLHDILRAFLDRGLLFDINIISYIFFLPFVIISIFLLKGKKNSLSLNISNIIIILGGLAVLLISSIDLGYFRYYNSRVTNAVFTWIEATGITFKVLFTEADNLLLVGLFLLAAVGYTYLQVKIYKEYLEKPSLTLKIPFRIIFFLAGLLLLISGLRGTFNFKDTPLICRNAFFTDDHFMNQLGFNPVYHLGHSFNDPQIHHYKDQEEFIEAALHHLGRTSGGMENPFQIKVTGQDSIRPNILLIFLESMSNAMVSRYKPGLNTTPFLDSIARQGIAFDNFYSAGIHTHNAIFTTLYGLPAVMDNVPMNSLATENQVFHGLPFILKEKGYQTSFYVTGSKEFDNMHRFLSLNGFDRIIGNADYPEDAIYNHWGATDETMFREVLKDCDSLSRSGLPFFSCVLTISSHDGYIVPEAFETRLENEDYPELLYEYADLQLEQFMLAAMDKDWSGSTVFLFIGDHGQNFDPVYDLNLNYHRVPCIVYSPALFRPQVYAGPGLQQDVYPTLCGLLGMSYVNNGLGVDLFDHRRKFGYFSADNKLGVVSDSCFLVYRGKDNVSLYDLRDNSTSNLYLENKAEAKEMLDYAFAMVQSAQYLIGNKLTSIKIQLEERHDVSRFIAHAGGMIDGNIYTNSLEALDRSYGSGFRLFELDILRTSDNRFVAAHTWDDWKKMTGYRGPVPPPHTTFMEHKILGKYSPLDMELINEWFSAHPDAILVTDKINEPAEFAAGFTDKNRLMMELFTMDAVKEGLTAGIRSAMPNWKVVQEMDGDIVLALKRSGITDIAVSRRAIGDNLPDLLRLKHNGIRAFVYHVNSDKGKDEKYVMENEMDVIYGLYADKLPGIKLTGKNAIK